ncbi:MAG: N-acetylmuramoyl-L-alanine amidase [Spirochaetes bacterium]|nr:MAG: N-acetylmuramoyl-L-alanine amidase [Spirochaetota bacterium]
MSTAAERFSSSIPLRGMVLLLFLLLPMGVYADSVSLEDLLIRTGATLHWDPWRSTGRLSRDDTVLVFRAGDPWMVLNGEKLIVSGTIIEEQGTLIFSREAAQTIIKLFDADSELPGSYNLTTILIDPGHGGRDSGARRNWPVDGVSYTLMEKDIVLEIALRLAENLRERFPDKNVILTRNRDVYPTLEDRVTLANGVELKSREGMIYLSIHANASLNPDAEGYEVWYLPRDYRRTLVDEGSLGGSSNSIAPIVNALWEEEFTHESVRLADMILKEFGNVLGPDIPNRGRREESWFVVRNARMASVLVEVGFVTQDSESGRLRRPEYLSRITEGLYNGVVDFVNYFESKEIRF